MSMISRKQLYWGIGIAASVATIGIIIVSSKKEGKKDSGSYSSSLADRSYSWIMPVVAKVSSPFGYRTHPITKVQQFHNGIDLPVPLKTKVKSPMPGVVASVYSNSAGGNQLTIKHDNGFTTGYAHLTEALVKKGDRIKQGDVIALSGNTGKSTGPHVHLTLKDKAGNWMDAAKMNVG